MTAPNVISTCPMCGCENSFPQDEIQQIVEPSDRLSTETVIGRYAECHDCGERIDMGLPEGQSRTTKVETALAFLAIAGMAAVLIAAIWKMTQ